MEYDLDGQEVITQALRGLVNEYPALNGKDIAYAVLDADNGVAMFPVSGSAIVSTHTDITGHVTQNCEYPFIVVYRAGNLSENKKANIKEWLDNLGRWLERQPILINGIEHKLEEYPALSRGRTIKRIARTSPAYLDSVKDNGAENWTIYISAQYINEF